MRRRSANGSSGMRSRWSHRSEARTPMRSPLTVAWRWPTQNAELIRRLADITDARLRAGDISELEARGPQEAMRPAPKSFAVRRSTIAIWRGSRWRRCSVSIGP